VVTATLVWHNNQPANGTERRSEVPLHLWMPPTQASMPKQDENGNNQLIFKQQWLSQRSKGAIDGSLRV
jgi:hypothetical protein